MIRRASLIAAALAAFVACSEGETIDEATFVEFYADLALMQDTIGYNVEATDSALAILYERYDVSPETYRNTVDYYNKTQEAWKKFFDKVLAELERRRDDAIEG
jgi:hypothetical protein